MNRQNYGNIIRNVRFYKLLNCYNQQKSRSKNSGFSKKNLIYNYFLSFDNSMLTLISTMSPTTAPASARVFHFNP